MRKGPYGDGEPKEKKSVKTDFKHMHMMEKAKRPSSILKIQPEKSISGGKRGREY